jgi:hypothetical protein
MIADPLSVLPPAFVSIVWHCACPWERKHTSTPFYFAVCVPPENLE